MAAENSYTVEQFIENSVNTTMYYDKLALVGNSGTANIIIYNLLNDYIDDLKAVAKPVRLNDKEFARYKYKPKLLSYDIYDNTELFFIILAVNEMSSAKYFNSKNIKLVPKAALKSLLNSIYNSEKDLIIETRNKVGI